MGCAVSARYSSSSCSRLVAVTVTVRPMYLAPLLGRISTVAGSKPGSKRNAISTTDSAKPDSLTPITLIGKALGYSISERSAGGPAEGSAVT